MEELLSSSHTTKLLLRGSRGMSKIMWPESGAGDLESGLLILLGKQTWQPLSSPL